MMLKRVVLTAGVLGVLAPGQAVACGSATFSASPITFTNWDPINGNQERSSGYRVTFNRNDNNARSARMIFLDNDAGPTRVQSTGPFYRIENVVGSTISYQAGTSFATAGSNVLSFTLQSGQQGNSVPVDGVTVVVPQNTSQADFPGGSTYSETLNFAVECTLTNSTVVSGSGTANIVRVTIPKIVSLTTASPQTLDFGTFTQAQQTLQVGLKSTSAINVTVSTQHGNRMVRSGAVSPFPTNEVISYNMTLRGNAIPAGGISLTNEPRAGVGGTTWPLVLTLPALPSGKLAGQYRDLITIDVAPGT